MQRRAVLSTLLCSVVSKLAMGEDKRGMRAFVIHMPGHLLEFSLPNDLAWQLKDGRVPDYFDPKEPDAFENAHRTLASAMHDFNGPFWTGALGSLSFELNVYQRSTKYEGNVTTAEGLENYIDWWIPTIVRPHAASRFGRVVVNGIPAVSRGAGSWNETISFPLDEASFVEFRVRIVAVAGRTSGGWAHKAEVMRDSIRASIVVRKK